MTTVIQRNHWLLVPFFLVLGCADGSGSGNNPVVDSGVSPDVAPGEDTPPGVDLGPGQDVSPSEDTGPGTDVSTVDMPTGTDAGMDGTATDVPPTGDTGGCTHPLTNCSATCVDLSSSGGNCGGCGNICATGTTCAVGVCTCSAGLTLCAGTCHNTQTDTANCGGCGMSCGAGQTCTAGACVMSTVVCPTGQTNCSGTCRDLTADLANCGSCGTVCAAGLSCHAGICVCATGTACTAADGTRSCVDLATSGANCGACGTACGTGQTCYGGVCVCGAGQTNCGGTCRTTATDGANCGRCGVVCPSGQTCTAGGCTATTVTCPTGQTNCGGTCRDTTGDSANCGGCGTVCAGGQVCASGRCGCPAGQSACAGTCIATASLQTDNNNCGGCGTVCHGGTHCAAGVCACPAGTSNCAGTCTATGTDGNNCGACGVVCPTGSACTAGHCACAGAGQTLCGSTCEATQTDRNNCGGCGVVCPAAETCTAGACACPAGLTACGTGSAVVCLGTQTDSANCGGCGVMCAAGQTCTAGACVTAPPSNDTRAGAITLDTTVPSVTTTGSLAGAHGDTTAPTGCSPACMDTAGDVFYTFTLGDTEVVYADTFGSATDTVLFLQDATGADITAAGTTGGASCNDDYGGACAGPGVSATDSRITAELTAGTYYLVVKSCFAATMDTLALRFQHLAVGNGASVGITPSSAGATVTGTTSGTGNLTPPAGCLNGSGTASAPDNTYWWTSCPNDAPTLFQATTCGSATPYDTIVYQQSADRTAVVCNDDQGFACGLNSSVTSQIPAGAGLHTVTVDGYNGASGSYSLSYREGSCVTGFSNCTGTCLQTSRFQTDNNNCGGCGTACAAGVTCTAGSCRPPNDDCTGATPIALGAPGTVTTVTGSLVGATHSTGTATPRATPDVWYSFTLGDQELVSVDTFGTTAFDTVVGLDTSCSATTLAASNDDSGCGTSCGPDVGCDFHSSQLVQVLGPGTYDIVVNTYNTAVGSFTLRIQRMQGISAAVGSVTATIPQGAYSLATDTTGAPTRLQACSGAPTSTPSPERTYVWTTCPAFAGGPFSATTCPGGTYDTLLQYRNSYNTGMAYNACDDDDSTCTSDGLLSTVSATEPAGAGMHVLTVSGWSGAYGTATVTGNRP